MRLLRPLPSDVRSVALLPAAYHPPTRAHEALLEAALQYAGAAVAVLPRALPHKEFDRIPFEARLSLIDLLASHPNTTAGTTEGGLFVEIAREAREQFPTAEIWIVCGRDAAERIVAWDYSGQPPIEEQLNEFGILVAPRGTHYQPPPALSHRIRQIPLDENDQRISSTELRELIAAGKPWTHLTPARLHAPIARLYS